MPTRESWSLIAPCWGPWGQDLPKCGGQAGRAGSREHRGHGGHRGHRGQAADPGAESSCLGKELCPAASSLLSPQVPLPWVGTEVELGSIQEQLPRVLQGQQGRSSRALRLPPPSLFIDSASYSAETNPHCSRVLRPAAPASPPSAAGSIFWGALAAPQHHPAICRARGWPGQGDSPQGTGGDTKTTLKASQDGLSVVGGEGWDGWGGGLGSILPPLPACSPLDSGAGSECSLPARVYFYSPLKNIPVRVTGT